MRQLIPLYINGSLSAAERLSFEQELWRNRELRREYAEFVEIEAAFRAMEQQAFPDLGLTLEILMTRVLAPPAPTSEPRTLGQTLLAMLATPRFAWTAAGVQLAIIAALVANDWVIRDAPLLQSLSQSADTRAARRFNVVFSDQASQAEIRALLQEIHVRITDGPTAVGLMTLEVRDEHADTQTLLMKLRASRLVRFAEAQY
jgi:anti-sigma factor RsiW